MDELRIRKQFDVFCRRVVKNAMIDYERHRLYVLEHEVSLTEVYETVVSKISVQDEYSIEADTFRVFGFETKVHDVVLSEVLRSLEKKRRDIILLSFFIEMTDTEIAEFMGLARSTVHYNRQKALVEMRKLLEDIGYEV